MGSFGKVITALITPFNEKMEVDYQQLVVLTEKLMKDGNEAILLLGNVAEFVSLRVEEMVQIMRTVKRTAGNNVKLIAGTGLCTTDASIELARLAEKEGMDAILVMCPYVLRPNQQGLYFHFKMIAESTALPVIIYNAPSRTGVNLLPDTVLRLSSIPNIKAIKESSGNFEQVSELISTVPKDFEVYAGDDIFALPILSLGGVGVFSLASYFVYNEMVEMVKSYKTGDVARATCIHHRLVPFFKALTITTTPVPLKAALEILDYPVGRVRLPLIEPSLEEQNTIRGTLQKMGVLIEK